VSALVLGIGTHPLRLDLSVHAGDPLDHYIPVRDAAGVLLDLTSWSASATVLTADGGTLATLDIVHDATGLTVLADEADTAAWLGVWPTYSPWRIRAAHPSGEPIFRAAGWVSLYP
jgi:hypothetical protein